MHIKNEERMIIGVQEKNEIDWNGKNEKMVKPWWSRIPLELKVQGVARLDRKTGWLSIQVLPQFSKNLSYDYSTHFI